MKKRTEQIIKYFHRRSFNLAFNDENGNYNIEDTIKKIQDFTYEERIDYNHYNSDICYNWKLHYSKVY